MNRDEFVTAIFKSFCECKRKSEEAGTEFWSGMAHAYETVLKEHFKISVSFDWVSGQWKMVDMHLDRKE